MKKESKNTNNVKDETLSTVQPFEFSKTMFGLSIIKGTDYNIKFETAHNDIGLIFYLFVYSYYLRNKK